MHQGFQTLHQDTGLPDAVCCNSKSSSGQIRQAQAVESSLDCSPGVAACRMPSQQQQQQCQVWVSPFCASSTTSGRVCEARRLGSGFDAMGELSAAASGASTSSNSSSDASGEAAGILRKLTSSLQQQLFSPTCTGTDVGARQHATKALGAGDSADIMQQQQPPPIHHKPGLVFSCAPPVADYDPSNQGRCYQAAAPPFAGANGSVSSRTRVQPAAAAAAAATAATSDKLFKDKLQTILRQGGGGCSSSNACPWWQQQQQQHPQHKGRQPRYNRECTLDGPQGSKQRAILGLFLLEQQQLRNKLEYTT